MMKFILVCIPLFYTLVFGQNPDSSWKRYQILEDAGFLSDKLAQAKAFYDTSNAKAVMIISHGNVVAAWGDVERRYKCHSMRKSLLNGLYGIYVKRGLINTNKNLGALGITDKIELTEVEKTAKVSDLMKTRSGVYLQAALEVKNTFRPKRGSHLPGTYMYYNNWDFNVLGSIFRQETKEDIFEAFKREIAMPLGMQDFRTMDGAYEYEEEYSTHPGYPFKMSTRDLARFGQLYLQYGRWNGKQIIDTKWIETTFTPDTSVSNTGNGATGYGYLWWIQERPGESRRYFAHGWGEQYLGVFPDLDMVIVIRSDSYFGKYLTGENRERLVNLIVASKTGNCKKNSQLVPFFSEQPKWKQKTVSTEHLKAFIGNYAFSDSTLNNANTKLMIEYKNAELIINGLHYAYQFRLLPIDDKTFFVEDINLELSFDFDKDGKPTNPRIKKAIEE